ncbi:MAG: hypothetical protein HW389_2700 [Bacteroidetes bacterium]|nr:hypothetical protein [Bacteroidota bacterium]
MAWTKLRPKAFSLNGRNRDTRQSVTQIAALPLCMGVLLGSAAVKTADGADQPPKSRVEKFKDYLANRPKIESVSFLRKLGPGSDVPGKSGARRKIGLYHGRWQSETMYYLQNLSSLTNVDEVGGTSFYSGRSNDVIWHVTSSSGRLVRQIIEQPERTEIPLQELRVLDLKITLNDTLNLSLPKIKSGTLVWRGDDFEAEVLGGKMQGHLNIEGELPKSIDYHGQATYLNPNDRYTVEYTYEPQSTSFLPNGMKSLRIESDKKILLMETTLLDLKEAADLATSLFDPTRFIIPRWDTMVIYSNKTMFVHPQGQRNRLVPVRTHEVLAEKARNLRFWYFAVLGILLSLPPLWLVGRRFRRSSSQQPIIK